MKSIPLLLVGLCEGMNIANLEPGNKIVFLGYDYDEQ